VKTASCISCQKFRKVNSRGYCSECIPEPIKGPRTAKKTPTRINKITTKQSKKIKSANNYYSKAIQDNINRNQGKCICENCKEPIHHPTGSNVSHIVAKGRNEALYLDKLNHFILCQGCECIWTNGERSKMGIYAESQERKVTLLRKHYLESELPTHAKGDGWGFRSY
jgi:5-methylcytosine-specific restriction endonuclease McrA